MGCQITSPFNKKLGHFNKTNINTPFYIKFEGKRIGHWTIIGLFTFMEIPEDVIKKFVKTRTFIRIKFLNHQLQAKAESARARNSMKQQHFQR